MDEIIDMLGEQDLFELEKMGFRYGDNPTDEDLLNAYLEDSEKQGAWFGNLRVKSGKEKEKFLNYKKKRENWVNDNLRNSVISVLKDIHNGAMSGQDMTDKIASELGDYYSKVEKSNDDALRKAYQLMRDEGANAEGIPSLQYKIAKDALELLNIDARIATYRQRRLAREDANVSENADNNDLKDAVISVLKDIYIGARSGQDMIDTITDKLGDYYQDVKQSGDARLQQAYLLMKRLKLSAEGDPEAQRRIANNALELLNVDAEHTARWHAFLSGDDEEDN